MSIKIVFETHALSEDNEGGFATGWLPGRLSERGRANAVKMGRRRRDDGIAAVFTSDLRRSAQAAQILVYPQSGGQAGPLKQERKARSLDVGGDRAGRWDEDAPDAEADRRQDGQHEHAEPEALHELLARSVAAAAATADVRIAVKSAS